jgi:hypothetical protein
MLLFRAAAEGRKAAAAPFCPPLPAGFFYRHENFI